MNMGQKIFFETDRRPIVKGTLDGKPAFVLVDTGATAGILDSSCEKIYGLKVNRRHPVRMVGAGGEFKAYLCETPLMLGGKPVYQFCMADISGVVASIRRETGIEIAGLVSLPQMKTLGIDIDTDDGYLVMGGK